MPATALRSRGTDTGLPNGVTIQQYLDWTRLGNIPNPSNIITFVTDEAFLNRPNLYPRQGTLLKIIFLRDDLFTPYDNRVIDEWIKAYQESADLTADIDPSRIPEGNHGIVPDVRERIKMCKAEGRDWFGEVVAVAGRRGSKGHIGGLAGAYVLWHYIQKRDPQFHYGVDRDKRLTAFVFAGKKQQAKENQWSDLNNVILGAPCFSPFISRPLNESLTIYAPSDFGRIIDRHKRGVYADSDIASFEIVPKESTAMAGRGPASFMQFYDEMAHVVATGTTRDIGDVYDAATPALDQFGVDAFKYLPSSPWQKLGKFREKYENALEVEDGKPVYPELLMFQLESWDLYKDWEIAHEIEMVPGGIPYKRLRKAIQTFDEPMRRLQRANPETFAVERLAHFAAALNAYLQESVIADMWKAWPDENSPMQMQSKGLLDRTYRAHGDPSKSGANFGFAIAHMAGRDERGLPHVIFDFITHWIPGDFEDGIVDYPFIGEEIAGHMDAFVPSELSFDQFNSVETIQRLQRHARKKQYPKRVSVYERNANKQLNWNTYEVFKTALGLHLIHAPYYEQADLELRFLQDLNGKVEPPTTGPVQTKDVADCLAIITYELIGGEIMGLLGKSLSELPVVGSQPGGLPLKGGVPQQEETHEQLSQAGRRMARRYPGQPRQGRRAPRR